MRMTSPVNDQSDSLEELAKSVKLSWQRVDTAQTIASDGQSGRKVLAQCCKPGPCSPKG